MKDYPSIWPSHHLSTLGPGSASALLIGRYNPAGVVVNDADGVLAQWFSNWSAHQKHLRVSDARMGRAPQGFGFTCSGVGIKNLHF